MSGRNGGSVIMGVLFCVVGVAVAIWGFKVISDAKASTSWPTADGKITRSEVRRKTKTSGTGTKRKTTTTYEAEISYSYSVDGVSHTSDKVAFGSYSSSSRGHADGIVSRYPVGAQVKVHYSPDKPDLAVLESGTSFTTYVPLGMGVVFVLAGIAVAFGKGMVSSGRGDIHIGVGS